MQRCDVVVNDNDYFENSNSLETLRFCFYFFGNGDLAGFRKISSSGAEK